MAQRRKTAAEIRLQGNARHLTPIQMAERAAEAFGPVGPVALPRNTRTPRGLGKFARRKFRDLIRREVFCDVETAELYSRLFEQKLEAEADVAARGRVLESERGFKANPSVKEALDCSRALAGLLVRFGRKPEPGPGEPLSPGEREMERMLAEVRNRNVSKTIQ